MNNLTVLNLSGQIYLQYLDCYNNLISGINLNNCFNITELYIQNNDLSGEFNLSEFPNISGVNISNNKFTEVTASGLNNLNYLYASGNDISEIYLSGSVNISGLNLSDNELSGNLDLTEFENLVEVNVSGNNLTGINITGLNKLETFVASNNLITGTINFLGVSGVREVLIQNNLITGIVNFEELNLLLAFNSSNNDIADLTPVIVWATGQYGLMAVASGLFIL